MAAVNIGEPYKVSNSEIQTFKECRRKWYLNYYRHLQPKTVKHAGPLALGTRVHAALEAFYNGEDLMKTYLELLEADRILALAEWQDVDKLLSEGEMGRIMLEGYVRWIEEEGIDSKYEIISNEETLSMPMLDGRVELRGKIDMRLRRKSDGTRLIRDFKTVGQTFEQYASTLHLNEQAMTYMVLDAYRNTPEDRADGAIFTLLKKNKQTARAKGPFYGEEEVLHNEFTLRSFWIRLNAVLSDMMNVKDALDAGALHQGVAYPRPSNDCTWKCPFFNICGMMDDGSPIEEIIADNYTVYNPNERYDDKKGNE
ncbi:RecB-like exonuclease/helicase [Microbacterium phage Cece]|nr:RecB-like exonuclease/helicase [Microbacterium phage Cece]